MWKSLANGWDTRHCAPHPDVKEFPVFHKKRGNSTEDDFSTGTVHKKSVNLCKKLQRGIDIGGNVPNGGLQRRGGILQTQLHLSDGVDHGGVISAKFPTDFRQREIG